MAVLKDFVDGGVAQHYRADGKYLQENLDSGDLE